MSKKENKKVVNISTKKEGDKPKIPFHMHAENLTDEDIELYANVLTQEPNLDKDDMKEFFLIGQRVVNLADIMTLMTFMDDHHKKELMNYIAQALQQISILEYAIKDKLDISDEEFQAYAEKANKDQEKIKEAYLKSLAEQQAQGEDE